jgi:hypothetical protein
MLTAMHLGNFKAFADTQNIPIRPITLIFGPNSAGKSSIIHGLALAHEAIRKGDLDIFRTELGGSSIDLGGFRQYVHRRQTTRRVEWGATFDTSRLSGRLSDLLKPVGSITVHLTIGVSLDDQDQPLAGSVPGVISCELESKGKMLLRMSNRPDGSMAIDRLNQEHPVIKQVIMAVLESGTTTQAITELDYSTLADAIADIIPSLRSTSGLFLPGGIVDKRQKTEETDSPIPFFSVSRGNRMEDLSKALRFFLPRSLNDLISGTTKTIRNELSRLQYLGPLRSYPSRHLAFSEHDDVNWYAGGGYAWDVVRRNAGVRDKVNHWLNNPDRLQTPYELCIRNLLTIEDIEGDYEEIVSSLETRFTSGEPYDWDLFGELYAKMKWLKKTEADRAHVQELVLLDKRTDTRVSHRDVGIGVSQVLPVLVSAYAAHNQIVAIEQPEIHLHPSLQAELGDVFIESALSGSTNTFLLETHSEHLILRIMRRMRETVNGNLPDGMHSVAPDDVSILYVQPTKEGSIVRVLELDAEGQLLDPWPGGFFEEGFRERFA